MAELEKASHRLTTALVGQEIFESREVGWFHVEIRFGNCRVSLSTRAR